MRIRISGFLLALCAVALGAFGYFMTCLALGWAMPNWVPAEFRLTPQEPVRNLAALQDTLVGQAAAYLLVFAGLAGLTALWMLVTGRRNWLLTGLLLAMFVMAVAFWMYTIAVVLARVRSEILERESTSAWVAETVLGKRA